MAHVRLFKHYFHLPFMLLGLIDLVVLVASCSLAVFFRFFGDAAFFNEHFAIVFPSLVVFSMINLTVMMALGAYQASVEEGMSGMMLRTILALILAIPVQGFAYFVASDWLWYLGSFDLLSSAAVLSVFCLGIARVLFFGILGKDRFKRRVVVLGAGRQAKRLLQDLTTPFNRKGFTLDGFIPMPDESVEVNEKHLINNPGSLHEYVIRHPVREIVIAVDDRRRGLPMDDLLECKMAGVSIIDGINFYERESRKVALEMLTRGWLVFSDGYTFSAVYGMGKRALDIITAAVLLVFTFPIMLLTALAIKVEDGISAPVVYSQERVGVNNRVFRVYKFRSMVTDAEKGGAVWAKQNDSRVTKVGDFIRRVRIDELPQIFNVLNGSMAFVGPRPERPVFVEQLTNKIPFYAERHRVKPGLTGWAQLCFAYADNEEDTREKLRYDLYYIKNQSLLLDLLIVLQTVEVVLFKKGSR
ncbi:TIGR03013 family XrtA/PEP-CTERM system glycosyltransferase [Marinobacter sp. AL4B]|uniref:TIGR03013 family XrtA/PEP-CTERM system glycosyltransferase n=1 Tax=Marinobacter sp. AL4B TaxID=2871173 RepID=UPI001CAA68F9|nr:TIGR03013 family XrtA/PEP-CTERM system glycosyltransferase [Marinobacter sp. AL4B]MBZ0333701.1 TIGR03013 family PEP-CTERM/XrtA system glycosyltransferase [Marinobacter sp. AL4B]